MLGAAAVAVIVVVAVVVVRLQGGSGDGDGDGSGGGSGGDGWTLADHSNSGLLTSDGQRICSTTASSVVFCVDPGSGDEVLRVEMDRGLATPPTLLDDRLVVASAGGISGDLYAYDFQGERLWQEPLVVNAEQDLPVVGGIVTVIDSDGDELVGVRVDDGEEAWRLYTDEAAEEARDGDPGAPDGPHVSGRDVFTDGTLVYTAIETIDPRQGSASGNIVAIDPSSGTEVWRSDTMGDIGFGTGITTAAPFEDGSAVAFLMDGEPRRMVVLDNGTGALRWEAPIATPYADIVDAAGATIVADGPRTRALDRDGATLWDVASPVIARSPSLIGPGELVVDGGRLWVAGYDVYELDPATGASELIEEGVDATDVAVVGDLLVIAGIGELEAAPLPPEGGG